jgi:hypothetical protein
MEKTEMINLPKMSIVYIAGPYTPLEAKTNHDYCRMTQWNVDHAVDAGICLLQKNLIPYIPHLTHYIQMRMQEDFGDKWYGADLVILERCDAILMLNGWETSKGAKLEYDYAMRHNMPIYFEEDLNC